MPTSGLSSIATRLFHKSLTLVLGITIKTSGKPNQHSTLFISNHISWLDILIIGQIVPAHFLSMIEVKSWPVAGWLASRAGTLYIERGGKHSTEKSLYEISHALKIKHNVVIFPEGRTTNGPLRKFHSRLIQSAVESNADIQPIAMEYKNNNSIIANPAVHFTGDITFLTSLIRILAQKKIDVSVSFLSVASAHNLTRTELTRHAEDQIRAQLNQIV